MPEALDYSTAFGQHPAVPDMPAHLSDEFTRLAARLGYEAKRKDAWNSRWKLFERMLAYVNAHPDLFS